MPVVFVTGATGEVARGVLPYLADRFDLKLFAPDADESDARCARGTLLDWHGLEQNMAGADAVLHLAIAGGHSGLFEDDAFNDLRFDINVKGAYHLFEAARRARVRRVVYVSSLMVTWGWARDRSPFDPPVAGDAPPNPVGIYALTKTLGEQIARHYARRHNLEVVALRIGAPLDLNRPPDQVRPQQVPFSDLAQAFHLALTMPLSKYEVVSVCGNSSRSPWSLDAARRILGYQPQYDLDALGLTFRDPFDVEPI